MDWRVFGTVFATILLAEMGDKTQLATMLYASSARHPKLTVFAAASLALVLASAMGVAVGAGVSRWADPRWFRWAAGTGFILVGVWTLLRG